MPLSPDPGSGGAAHAARAPDGPDLPHHHDVLRTERSQLVVREHGSLGFVLCQLWL